jgi:hypothetical protein
MKIEQTINYIVGVILNKYLLTAHAMNIHISEDEIRPDMKNVFSDVLKKLELDEKIITLVNAPHIETNETSYGKYTSYEIKVYDNLSHSP